MNETHAVLNRRYYFANTLAGVITRLGVPERVKPERSETSIATPEHIAWMAIKVARMDVHDPTLAPEARTWTRRIMQAMEVSGYWTREEAQTLHNLDKEQHFNLPVLH